MPILIAASTIPGKVMAASFLLTVECDRLRIRVRMFKRLQNNTSYDQTGGRTSPRSLFYIIAVLFISLNICNAQAFYIWRQSAWGGGAKTTAVSTSSNGNSNYYSSDGNAFFTGTDGNGNSAVILKPLGVIAPMYKSYGESYAAGLSASLANVGGSNVYDFYNSVDGNG
ncbi:MAG: hypothetical protein AABZ39_20025, partial [Spirochaetota bacterium]